jgi:hypothetical protein
MVMSSRDRSRRVGIFGETQVRTSPRSQYRCLTNETASPLTCPENYNCMITMHLELNFGCCNNIECAENWGICRDYGQKGCMGNALDDVVCASIVGSILQWYVLLGRLDLALHAYQRLQLARGTQLRPLCTHLCTRSNTYVLFLWMRNHICGHPRTCDSDERRCSDRSFGSYGSSQ